MPTLEYILNIVLTSDIIPNRESEFWLNQLDIIPPRFHTSLDLDGNIILSTNHTRTNNKILIEAHTDSVGLIVKEQVDKGLYRCQRIGMLAPWDVRNQQMTVHAHSGNHFTGIVLGPAAHFFINKNYEQYQQPILLAIDPCFAPFIQCGDVATYTSKVTYWSTGLIISPYLDNKAAIAAILHALWKMTKQQQDHCVVCLSIREEENATRLDSTMNTILPKMVISIDATIPISPFGVGDAWTDMHKGRNSYLLQENYPKVGIQSIDIPCNSMHSANESMTIADIMSASSKLIAAVEEFSLTQ